LHYHRSKVEAEKLESELRPLCASIHILQADLTNDEGCLKLHEDLRRHTDFLDVLINNAGGMVERKSVNELSWQHLLKSFELNVFSTMRLTSLCTELLLKSQAPVVINVTSIAMRHGAPTATAYGAAKSAIDSFTRGAALELAPKIRVNAVAPGIIDTRFHERVTSEEKMKQLKEATPLKRFGSGEEIGRTIKFLIENEFLTGATIDCNGGLSMR